MDNSRGWITGPDKGPKWIVAPKKTEATNISLMDWLGIIVGWVLILAVILVGVFGFIDAGMTTYHMTGIAVTGDINRNESGLNPEHGFNPRGSQIPILINHSTYLEDVIGHVTLISRRPNEVYFEALLTAGKHQDIIDRLVDWDIGYVSVGYISLGEPIDGISQDGDIMEISIVAQPADPGAVILSIERLGLWYYLKELVQ